MHMKVLLCLSGGIDSSVSANLLLNKGFVVEGVNMMLWSENFSDKVSSSNSCFSPNKEEQQKKVSEVAKKIGIPVTFIDCSDVFEKEILSYFKDEYLSAHTPNPCIMCNPKVKFGTLIERAKDLGLVFDKIATGHYARIDEINGRFCLRRAKDLKKDQSYFLYRLNQKQLSSIIFPLGEMTKVEAREIDVKQGYHEDTQTESQDFYSGPYSDLLDIKPLPGDIVDLDGKVRGKHQGFWNYTIGQRKGLGIAAPRPLYVVELRAKENQVVVAEAEAVNMNEVRADNIVWGKVEELTNPISCFAKIRSTGEPQECVLEYKDGSLVANFVSDVKAAAPGQSLVAYDQDGYVLCGGIIK